MIASAHQNSQRPNLPLLGFAAYSGTGKTTLLEALLPKLTAAGLRIGLLKHAHHDFDVDKPVRKTVIAYVKRERLKC